MAHASAPTPRVFAKRIKSTAVSENPVRMRIRISCGVLVGLLTLVTLLRVPYVGEFLDGVVADLLLFGTAKFVAYALLFVISVLLCFPSRKYWRPLATRSCLLLSLTGLGFCAGIFSIIHFETNWQANPTIKTYLDNFFATWKTDAWAHGEFVWQTPPLVSGGMWWALVAAINAGAASVLLFVLLFLLVIGFILALLLKFRVKQLEFLRRKVVAWLGGYWRQPNQSEPTTVLPPPTTTKPITTPELKTPPVISAPPLTTKTTTNNLPTTPQNRLETPFSVLYAQRHGHPFVDAIQGQTEDYTRANERAAQQALINLTDLFATEHIPGQAQGWSTTPAHIVLAWDLNGHPEATTTISQLRYRINKALNCRAFDVFLDANNVLTIRYPTPQRSKVALGDIQKKLQPSAHGLTVGVGWDVNCAPLSFDLLKTQSLAVVGTQGSGRTMFLSSLLLSALTAYSPAQLMLGLVDTAGSHLGRFEGVAHLLTPIPEEPAAACVFFDRLSREFKYRIRLLRDVGVRTVTEYNAIVNGAPLKRILLVINDVADLYAYNPEYMTDLLRVLNARGAALGCAVVLSSRTLTPFLEQRLAQTYGALVGFRVEEPNCQARIYREHLARLSGRGEFVIFNNYADGLRKATTGQTAFVADRELQRLVALLTDGDH